jgi:hypothetical protein
LPLLFLTHETITRIRPSKDPIVEASKRSDISEVASLARIGAALRELRMAKRISLSSIEDTFEISSKQLDDFEHGRGDLPVSYLMTVAAMIEFELVLVPAQRRADGSLVGVDISLTATMNRIVEEDDA